MGGWGVLNLGRVVRRPGGLFTMNRSYKIALVVSVVFCVAVVAYYRERSPRGGSVQVAPAVLGEGSSVGGVEELGDGGDGGGEVGTVFSSPHPRGYRDHPGLNRDPPAGQSADPLEYERGAIRPPTLTLGRTPAGTLPLVATPPRSGQRGEAGAGASDLDEEEGSAGSAGGAKVYTVQVNDTLSSIAVTLYGSERFWVDLAQANPLVDPVGLKVGQELRLPAMEGLADVESQDLDDLPPEPTRTVTYVVRSGDSLYTIAKQYYNRGELWRYVYAVNRKAIGENPNTLKAGTVLRIPPAPQRAR